MRINSSWKHKKIKFVHGEGGNCMFLTVLTATYNRCEQLKKLYSSLCKQSYKDFKWLIIDDGSSDETYDLIENFVVESKINIEYKKKENGGKHTALNTGIALANTPLIFIVDSDDWLEGNAIEEIYQINTKYENMHEICGYSFLRKFPDGKINGKEFSVNALMGSYIDVRINGNDMDADKAEVWKTSCLREVQFPKFDAERFLGEDAIWIQLALKYKMVHINSAIYIGEYQEDGLTKNRRSQNIKSPNGCVYRAEICMSPNINLKFRLKSMLQYQIYGKFARKSTIELYKRVHMKFWFIILRPIALILYSNWKMKNVRSLK